MRPRGLTTIRFKDRDLSDVARDTDAFMRSLTQLIPLPRFDAIYTEPLNVALDQEPLAVVLLRAREIGDLEAPVMPGGFCPFLYSGIRKQAAVQLISGLVLGTQYRFDFAVIV